MSFWTKICNLFKGAEKQEQSQFSRFPRKTKYEEQFDRDWRIFSDILTIEYIDRYKPLVIPLTEDINYLRYMQRMHDTFARMFWESRREEIESLENDKSN